MASGRLSKKELQLQVNGVLATMSGNSAVLIWALRYYNLRQNLTTE